MGALTLLLLYLVTAALLTALVAWWCRRNGRRPPSAGVALILSLLPLTFTVGGFLPGKTLAPNGLLAGVPPWCHPDLVETFAVPERAGINPTLLDPLSQMQPWRHAAREGWLLDPAAHGGAALLGNGQSAVLFPLEVAARWLPPARGNVYIQAARLLLAVWGLFFFLRLLALGEVAALAGVVVFLGGGFLQLWRLHPHTSVAALAPWVMAAALGMMRRPGPGSAVALAITGALGVFAGHPETLLHTVLFTGLFLLPFLKRRFVAVLGWSSVAAMLAVLLAAPALFPFLSHLSVSYEWQERMEAPDRVVELEAPWPEVAFRLAPMLDVFALGDPRHPSGVDPSGGANPWQGPENLMELGGGAVALAALALLPVALGRGRYRRVAWWWLAVALFALAVAVHTPGIARPVEWVPLLRDSLVKRWSLWWVVGSSLLTALAVRRLGRKGGDPAGGDLDRGGRGGDLGAVADGAFPPGS